MPGAGRTRSLACKMKKHTSIVTGGWPNAPAFPAQWFDRLLRALPGVSGLLATVAREIVHELDPSVEGTGPHGLTVHNSALRQTRHHVHRIPRQRIVTIAKRPSW